MTPLVETDQGSGHGFFSMIFKFIAHLMKMNNISINVYIKMTKVYCISYFQGMVENLRYIMNKFKQWGQSIIRQVEMEQVKDQSHCIVGN